MASDPGALTPAALDFVTVRHLATLTTVRADGSPHVTPVGFTWDPDRHLVRVITRAGSQKTRNVAATGLAAVCQVQGRHWLTFEGRGRVAADAAAVREAEERYALRYRTPRPNPERVALEITVQRVLGNV